MDMIFSCPNCKQQLEADSGMSGTAINCPSCGVNIVIPEADPANVRTANPNASSAAAKEEKHFSVPVHDTPGEMLIKKPARPLEMAAKDGDKRLHIRCIRRTECVEVGKDHFEEVVTKFLGEVGETNIVSVTPINYTHVDMGTRQVLTDYGVLILFRG